ncbi:MAG: ABC transporter permease [Micrococcales bacterium]|nr:ABC transporter permease [Micrococcales bacterium]
MSSEPGSAGGVIHDIGYRGYLGARLDRPAITASLFVHTLRGVYGLGRATKTKVVPFSMVAVMMLPALVLAAISVVGASQGDMTEPALPYTRFAMVTQAAIAIFLAVAAPQAVSLDLRFGTLPLYLSRPLERRDYVRAKLGALSAAVFVLIAGPLLVMYLGALGAQFNTRTQTVALLQALVGAALLSGVLASMATVVASLTGRRGLGIAGIVTMLTLSYAIVSTLQGLINYQGDKVVAGWAGLFSPMTLVDGVQVWAFGVESSTPAGPPGTTGGIVFLAVAFAVIGSCYAILLARYREETR